LANAPLLCARGVTVTFGGVDVVAGVDLDLWAGEVHAIVGENGAGKSSLAKAIAGVYRMRDGAVSLDGREAVFKSPREALASGVALIHQEPQGFPDLDVAENVFAGNFVKKGWFVDRAACRRRSGEILHQLGTGIDPRAALGTLSVAQRQMVEVASALGHEARVWLFDETTAPLTPKEAEELFTVMRRLRDQGCALAFVSHHLHEVFAIADRVTVLRDGRRIDCKPIKETSPAETVQLMVGREIEQARLRGAAPGACVLQTRALSGPGFSDATVRVCKGEVVGLAGLVGAGRTELCRALFGIGQAWAGTIELEGRPVQIASPGQARNLGIALVPEDRIHHGLLLPQSIAFNFGLANLDRFSKAGWLDQGQEERAAVAEGARLQLVSRGPRQPVQELSGGNQQKVALGKWLLTEPRLLVLDEPTRGVDVGAKREVHRTVRSLADEGLAVLMASSDLPELIALCDRTYVMRGGRIVAELGAHEASEEAVMRHAVGADGD
jgi:rhamnose transport system ATP-binding protein